MDRERIIARLMPDLLDCVEQELAAIPAEHTWYTLEECAHHLMRQIGQRFLQEVGEEEGSGLVRPSRVCPTCGGEQAYHDQHHPLTLLNACSRSRIDLRVAATTVASSGVSHIAHFPELLTGRDSLQFGQGAVNANFNEYVPVFGISVIPLGLLEF